MAAIILQQQMMDRHQFCSSTKLLQEHAHVRRETSEPRDPHHAPLVEDFRAICKLPLHKPAAATVHNEKITEASRTGDHSHRYPH
ncbi:unnamed protein product [Sphagnum balticum]|jgi:hypothetical protein